MSSTIPTNEDDHAESVDLLKRCLGDFIVYEMKSVVQAAAYRMVEDNQEIQELKETIRYYEDHIKCLEQLVRDLQSLLRNELNKPEGAEEDENSSTPSNPENVTPTPVQQSTTPQHETGIANAKSLFSGWLTPRQASNAGEDSKPTQLKSRAFLSPVTPKPSKDPSVAVDNDEAEGELNDFI